MGGESIHSSSISGDVVLVLAGLQCTSGWWLGTLILFFHILEIVNPADFHIFQRGRSTTNQHIMCHVHFHIMLVWVKSCIQLFRHLETAWTT